jgi:hypothetical protein
MSPSPPSIPVYGPETWVTGRTYRRYAMSPMSRAVHRSYCTLKDGPATLERCPRYTLPTELFSPTAATFA